MIAIDIETVPLAASMTAEYPEADRPHPSTYKNAEAILPWRAADRAKWEATRVKEYSTNPRLGRIFCIALHNGIETRLLAAETEGDEKRMLEGFWRLLNEWRYDIPLATWNGQFDLRFLVIRSLAYGLTPSVSTTHWFKKYDFSVHFDAKAALMNWDVKATGEGLDEWAAFFGLPGKPEGIDGSKVYDLYLKGEFEQILHYCAHDAETTFAIARHIQPFYTNL